MSKDKPVEWRCLVGGTPNHGYTGCTLVGRVRIVTEEKKGIPEVLEELQMKVEAILRESGDDRKIKMILPWQKRTI